MHAVALNYPVHPSSKQVDAHRTFYTVLQDIIPCKTCAENYKKHLTELPLEPNLEDAGKLFQWTVAMHNIVNKMLGKPIVSVDKARMIHGTDSKDRGSGLLVVVLTTIATLIALVLVLIYKKFRQQPKST